MWINLILFIYSILTLFIQIDSLIKQLNETNYENWVDSIKLFLAISNVDVALIEDEPPIPTDITSAEEKMKYERWTHSNKICLMTMKNNMEKTVKDNILEATNAKNFLVDVENKFKKFDKNEKSIYLNLLTKTSIMVLVVSMNMQWSSLVGITSSSPWRLFWERIFWFGRYWGLPIMLKEEWSVDELISILPQEEQSMKNGN